MPFTREFVRNLARESGIEMPKEFENGLIDAHLEARDSYAEAQVETALAENKPEPPVPVKDSEEYKALQTEFDNYKGTVKKKEAKAAKETAAKAYYKGKGMSDAAIELAIMASEKQIDGLELDGEKIKDTAALDALCAGVFASMIPTEQQEGADQRTPPPGDPTPKAPSSLAEALHQQYDKKG